MKHTDTKAEHWQCACLEWGEVQEVFEVRNVSVRHLVFMNEFCAAYKYKYQSHGVSILNLIPKNHHSNVTSQKPKTL